MTMNEQSKVVEATVLGENCGACRLMRFTGSLGPTLQCYYSIPGPYWALLRDKYDDGNWNSEGIGFEGIYEWKLPPGRSVCPNFEEQK
jgi:hypothetical protein